MTTTFRPYKTTVPIDTNNLPAPVPPHPSAVYTEKPDLSIERLPCPICGVPTRGTVGFIVSLCPKCRASEQAILEGRLATMWKVLEVVDGRSA